MSIFNVQVISFLFISIVGSVLHFTHGWFKKGFLLHIFSATNESTWEHMKLLLLPTLLIIPFQYYFLNETSNFFNSIFVLLIVQTISIPVIYEPLRIIFKKIHFLLTILLFEISIIIGLFIQYNVISNEIYLLNETYAILSIFFVVLVYGFFTFYPPKIFIFKDPVKGKYGDRL